MSNNILAQNNGCRKCGAEMKPSKAIVTKSTGYADFIGGEVCTMSPNPKQPVLVDCLKCSKCGWSVTNGNLRQSSKVHGDSLQG